jgi:hypothetical protein
MFGQTENNFVIQNGFVITKDIGFMWIARITLVSALDIAIESSV